MTRQTECRRALAAFKRDRLISLVHYLVVTATLAVYVLWH
jgi:hypothetical protein